MKLLDRIGLLITAIGSDIKLALSRTTDTPVAITPTTGAVVIDLSNLNTGLLALTGNPTFTTANRVSGAGRVIKINPGSSAQTPSFPAWKWLTPIPTTFAANKEGLLTLQAIGGTAETNVWASYVPQL